MPMTLLTLVGGLLSLPSTGAECTALAATPPAEIRQSVVMQSYGMPFDMVWVYTVDGISSTDYRLLETPGPDAATALLASNAGQVSTYTTWGARGLLKREMRDSEGHLIAAFSYPDDDVDALMQAEPGEDVVISQRNLRSRDHSRINIHFVGCQWLNTDAGRFFTRIYEKTNLSDGTTPPQPTVRLFIAEELGRIVREDLVGTASGLTLISTR